MDVNSGKPSVRITNIRSSNENGVQRVCAEVNGKTVWFESEDSILRISPEAFACAFLIPAMKLGGALCVEGDVSNVWKKNTDALQQLFSEWWGFPTIGIEAGRCEQAAVSGRTALFFSGGVDSFYSLLRSEMAIDELILVHGFDLALDETERFQDIRQHLAAVAEACGKPLRIIKTNLREHPLIEQAGWGKTHGGALAAVAHSLDGVSSVVVSSSYSRKISTPWGSHWQSDRFWSSEQMQLIHFGELVLRSDKMRSIADEPLVQQHLRVCWKNRNEHLNCCSCEKCVRTMILLESVGKLRNFRSFPLKDDLPEMIRTVRYAQVGLLPVYEDFLKRDLPEVTRKEIRALLRRSRLRLFRKRVAAILNPGSKQDET